MKERIPTDRLRKIVTTWKRVEPDADLTGLLVELLERREAEEKAGAQ